MRFWACSGLAEKSTCNGTGTARTNDASSQTPVPDQTIDFVYDMSEFVISIRRGQFQLQDQSVYLVDAHGHREPFLHRVLDQPLCVQHHLQGITSTNTP